MIIQFNDETFCDDYSFCNLDWVIKCFFFLFHEDSYMYLVNMEQHWGGPVGSIYEKCFDVDEHYVSEMRDRAMVLADDLLRCQSLLHMTLVGWDLLELIMVSKFEDYPDLFELYRDGDKWCWINKLLGIDYSFVFMDETTLPYGFMEYIICQLQGDFCVLDQRDANLWMDAGMVTTQVDWSLDFDIGMNFFEWHVPVFLAHEKGIFVCVLKFLLNIQQGAPVRWLNWTMMVNLLFDISFENYYKWGV